MYHLNRIGHLQSDVGVTSFVKLLSQKWSNYARERQINCMWTWRQLYVQWRQSLI